MSKKIKAIIFDMDGVLIDAKDWHYEALNEALHYFGMEITRYEHLSTYDGHPTKKKLEMLSVEKNLPTGLHPFICTLKQQFTINAIHSKCKPKFIQQYALSQLKKEGYLIAVCSNSIRATVELMLDKADILKHCEFVLSNEDVKKSKPDPEIYIKAFKNFKLKPEECLIVEDNPTGQKSALDSGGHLLKVKDTEDVNFENIMDYINDLEKEMA